MQLQTYNSPFNDKQTELLNMILPTLTEEQKIWLSGFLTASTETVLHAGEHAAAVEVAEKPNKEVSSQSVSQKATILFASQTGNGQMIADSFQEKLQNAGFEAELFSMENYKPKELKKVNHLFVISSTHGEGDPPDNALSFYEFLHSRKAPDLTDTHFSVLALGDTSYEFFCQTGKDFDKRLEQLGGKRLYERIDCDVDFEEEVEAWMSGVIDALQDSTAVSEPTPQTATLGKTAEKVQTSYGRTNPFMAEILENINLNGRGSNKETRHLELSLEGSGFKFAPGDSIGIFPENDPFIVHRLIDEMSWDPDEPIVVNKKGKQLSLQEALRSHYEITVLTKPLLEKAAKFTDNEDLHQLIENEKALKEYMSGRDLIDVGKDFGPWNVPPSQFVSILRKMPPRLYSIASSHEANPDEVHLTIGAVRYHANGRDRTGVCSIQCAERSQPGDTLPVFVQPNPNFKLPDDPDTPIIMVGPGTGVAPFRAFLEEREEVGANGKNWLFFGDQHFHTDFLYQTEWQQYHKDGILTKIDLAFSRDTNEKIYVQDRMMENSNELYRWINDGAVIYVCGDEKKMAGDVHQTLLTILQEEGGMKEEESITYLQEMQRQKRYQRDVY
ncbi:assimilatory sulfite reductase (NADPH) flavoprotein subunit [Alteribacillus iranensis]|uniref:assimilatory sulfite reductase (NADPH) n=1 Tax=Alteribacillus iranensis TaxID=930128 RepID=A0A1I1ZXI4_9BACI|nr:assimilatory sulfite reductase (NADPH) flavoprotein subunit [Alteribacillus iranensis]SFE36392.1 sulfite reductase (NADPH) alpha subunit [Alteribacillus iranensis]